MDIRKHTNTLPLSSWYVLISNPLNSGIIYQSDCSCVHNIMRELIINLYIDDDFVFLILEKEVILLHLQKPKVTFEVILSSNGDKVQWWYYLCMFCMQSSIYDDRYIVVCMPFMISLVGWNTDESGFPLHLTTSQAVAM